jgi:hypothetical protein
MLFHVINGVMSCCVMLEAALAGDDRRGSRKVPHLERGVVLCYALLAIIAENLARYLITFCYVTSCHVMLC